MGLLRLWIIDWKGCKTTTTTKNDIGKLWIAVRNRGNERLKFIFGTKLWDLKIFLSVSVAWTDHKFLPTLISKALSILWDQENLINTPLTWRKFILWRKEYIPKLMPLTKYQAGNFKGNKKKKKSFLLHRIPIYDCGTWYSLVVYYCFPLLQKTSDQKVQFSRSQMYGWDLTVHVNDKCSDLWKMLNEHKRTKFRWCWH